MNHLLLDGYCCRRYAIALHIHHPSPSEDESRAEVEASHGTNTTLNLAEAILIEAAAVGRWVG